MLRNTSTQATTVNNVGTYDRVVRMLFAATLLAPAFVGTDAGPLGWLALPVLASIYPAATAVMGWDPIYHALDLSTVRMEPEPVDAAQVAEALVRRYHGPANRSGATTVPEVAQSAASNNPSEDRRAA